MKKSFWGLVFVLVLLWPNSAFPAADRRAVVSDWYLKNFETKITVNPDSTLLVEERITADCGNLPDKHGIFRVLPTVFKTKDKAISMPVELLSITDFAGKVLPYSTENNFLNKTVSWKIGDPDRTVIGENQYRITYKIKNAILFGNPDFDELYWNLNGNFWEIETDKFTAELVFPTAVSKENAQVEYYLGLSGSQDRVGASYVWLSDRVLRFEADRTLSPKEGLTASVTFPKNIFTPYQPTFLEKYALYLWWLVPLAVFILCFSLWRRYGRDPRLNKTIIAEFEAPEKLSPLELGVLSTNGTLKGEFVTAAIVNLAVKGFLQIEEIKGRGFLKLGKDHKLIAVGDERLEELSRPEQVLRANLFGSKKQTLLSSLRNNFTTEFDLIKNETLESLERSGLINRSSLTLQKIFIFSGIGLAVATFFMASNFGLSLLPMIVTVLVVFFFSLLMPQRTLRGAEANWKNKGFKLYLETAEKYRAEFYEKENIFEKFLPYAIMFGLTKLWIKKMKEIYGQEYLRNYHPVWLIGDGVGSFDADSFSAQLDSLSSAMAASVSSGSGAGGSGGSGGGGGGGGGGGW